MLSYRKEKGFVLLIVLFFMQMLILMSWYSMEDILLFQKFNRNFAAHDLIYHQADNLLSSIESATISHLPDCIIPLSLADQLIKNPLIWWQSHGCSGNFHEIQYYYVIEPWTIDSCAIIEPINKAGAEYLRITLLMRSNRKDTRFFFQSTLIRLGINPSEQCHGIQHNVREGRQSWRELDY